MEVLKMALKRIFCRHKNQTFYRNIYGDEINWVSLRKLYRSWWICDRCGQLIAHQHLHEDGDPIHWSRKLHKAVDGDD